MVIILKRAIVFSVGVFVLWLQYALRVGLAPGGMSHSAKVLTAIRIAGCLAAASGVGAILGLRAARNATPSLPLWLTAVIGVAFGFLVEPAMAALHTAGLHIPGRQLGFLLTVALGAAVFVWLCAWEVPRLRRYCVDIGRELHRMNSNRAEQISFWLAVSVWVFGLTQMLRIPGFG